VGRPKRVEPESGERDWRKNPARARFPINPETGAPVHPVTVGELRGEALKRVQAHVEQWEREYPTYEELDEEGKRLADERMVRKFTGPLRGPRPEGDQ
jgi:hypothetical protein